MHDIHKMPGHLARRLQQISVAIFNEHMRRAGFDLTPVQFAALSAAAATPGMDQAQLARQIAYDPVTLSGVIDRLCKKGLVSRNISPTDRRARVIALTAAGHTLLAQASPQVAALQADILAPLEQEEQAQLLRLLKKITGAAPSA